MYEVDFLPSEYRQKRDRLHGRSTRIALVGAFALLLCGVAALQWRSRRAVQRQLDELIPQYALAKSQSEALIKLQAQLQAVQANAELQTYLRHPWPRSRILASVVGPLPKSITLTELRIACENAGPRPAETPRPPAPGNDPQQAKQVPAAVKDLKWLREKYDNARVVVYLQGVSSDVATLYQYIDTLSNDALFLKAESKSIEKAPGNDPSAMVFHAQIVVRPGFGQARGPVGPALAAANSVPAKGAGNGGAP